MAKRLTVDQRREIFRELVNVQDVVRDVPRSRQLISQKFGITEAQLRQIEDEGIERQWPPLEEEEEVARVK